MFATQLGMSARSSFRFASKLGERRTPVHGGSLYRNFVSTSRRPQEYIRFRVPQGQKPKNEWDPRNWNPRVQFAGAVVGLGGIYYAAHLEQVPDTGRWRFMNTSPKFEVEFGELSRNQLRTELEPATLPASHPISRHVYRVVTRILQASNLGVIRGSTQSAQPSILSRFGLGTDTFGNAWNPDSDVGAAADPGPTYGPDKEWDVIVVNDRKMINAMASPGVIVVFTGILPVCQDEEGLAAVVAHEIGHVVARHTAERISSQTIVLGILVVLQALGLDLGVSQIVQKLLMELPNSRTQELEADLIGLRLMSRACYNPEAAPQMFARMGRLEAKAESSVNLDFLQTHPSSANRVKKLKKALPEGYSILAANPECAGMREQIEAFKERAHEVKFDDRGGFELA
ncbi:peptidase family M48-domain-containing protein [Crassisporium funariophilum]|nr:peptidase family M48-domain-containing protein [Crassisporium funariophilum]